MHGPSVFDIPREARLSGLMYTTTTAIVLRSIVYVPCMYKYNTTAVPRVTMEQQKSVLCLFQYYYKPLCVSARGRTASALSSIAVFSERNACRTKSQACLPRLPSGVKTLLTQRALLMMLGVPSTPERPKPFGIARGRDRRAPRKLWTSRGEGLPRG